MGVIAAFFGTAFSGITSIFALFLARKASFSLAYIAVYLLITGVFIAVITGLLSSLVGSIPSNGFIVAGLSLLPSNTGICVGVISTAHVAAFVYRFKNKLLSLKVNA